GPNRLAHAHFGAVLVTERWKRSLDRRALRVEDARKMRDLHVHGEAHALKLAGRTGPGPSAKSTRCVPIVEAAAGDELERLDVARARTGNDIGWHRRRRRTLVPPESEVVVAHVL